MAEIDGPEDGQIESAYRGKLSVLFSVLFESLMTGDIEDALSRYRIGRGRLDQARVIVANEELRRRAAAK